MPSTTPPRLKHSILSDAGGLLVSEERQDAQARSSSAQASPPRSDFGELDPAPREDGYNTFTTLPLSLETLKIMVEEEKKKQQQQQQQQEEVQKHDNNATTATALLPPSSTSLSSSTSPTNAASELPPPRLFVPPAFTVYPMPEEVAGDLKAGEEKQPCSAVDHSSSNAVQSRLRAGKKKTKKLKVMGSNLKDEEVDENRTTIAAAAQGRGGEKEEEGERVVHDHLAQDSPKWPQGCSTNSSSTSSTSGSGSVNGKGGGTSTVKCGTRERGLVGVSPERYERNTGAVVSAEENPVGGGMMGAAARGQDQKQNKSKTALRRTLSPDEMACGVDPVVSDCHLPSAITVTTGDITTTTTTSTGTTTTTNDAPLDKQHTPTLHSSPNPAVDKQGGGVEEAALTRTLDGGGRTTLTRPPNTTVAEGILLRGSPRSSPLLLGPGGSPTPRAGPRFEDADHAGGPPGVATSLATTATTTTAARGSASNPVLSSLSNPMTSPLWEEGRAVIRPGRPRTPNVPVVVWAEQAEVIMEISTSRATQASSDVVVPHGGSGGGGEGGGGGRVEEGNHEGEARKQQPSPSQVQEQVQKQRKSAEKGEDHRQGDAATAPAAVGEKSTLQRSSSPHQYLPLMQKSTPAQSGGSLESAGEGAGAAAGARNKEMGGIVKGGVDVVGVDSGAATAPGGVSGDSSMALHNDQDDETVKESNTPPTTLPSLSFTLYSSVSQQQKQQQQQADSPRHCGSSRSPHRTMRKKKNGEEEGDGDGDGEVNTEREANMPMSRAGAGAGPVGVPSGPLTTDTTEAFHSGVFSTPPTALHAADVAMPAAVLVDEKRQEDGGGGGAGSPATPTGTVTSPALFSSLAASVSPAMAMYRLQNGERETEAGAEGDTADLLAGPAETGAAADTGSSPLPYGSLSAGFRSLPTMNSGEVGRQRDTLQQKPPPGVDTNVSYSDGGIENIPPERKRSKPVLSIVTTPVGRMGHRVEGAAGGSSSNSGSPADLPHRESVSASLSTNIYPSSQPAHSPHLLPSEVLDSTPATGPPPAAPPNIHGTIRRAVAQDDRGGGSDTLVRENHEKTAASLMTNPSSASVRVKQREASVRKITMTAHSRFSFAGDDADLPSPHPASPSLETTTETPPHVMDDTEEEGDPQLIVPPISATEDSLHEHNSGLIPPSKNKNQQRNHKNRHCTTSPQQDGVSHALPVPRLFRPAADTCTPENGGGDMVDEALAVVHPTAAKLPTTTTTTTKTTATTTTSSLTSPLPLPLPPAPTTDQEFNLASYRALHKRRFYSRSEELTFLRTHYLSSQTRIVQLHDHCKELRDCLMEKTKEADYWREQLLRLRQMALAEETASFHGLGSSPHHPNSLSRIRHILLSNTFTHPGKEGLEEEVGDLLGGGAGSARRPGNKETKESAAEKEGGVTLPSSRLEDHHPNALPSSPPKPKASSLWLYAATRPRSSGGASSGVSWRAKHTAVDHSGGNKCAACEALLQELRKNLARRDNDLSSMQLEFNDLSHVRHTMERELRTTKNELLQRTEERNQLQQTLLEKEKAIDALSQTERSLAEEKDNLVKELDKLKQKNEVLELISGEADSNRRGRRIIQMEEEDIFEEDFDTAMCFGEEENGAVVWTEERVVYDQETGEPIILRRKRRRKNGQGQWRVRAHVDTAAGASGDGSARSNTIIRRTTKTTRTGRGGFAHESQFLGKSDTNGMSQNHVSNTTTNNNNNNNNNVIPSSGDGVQVVKSLAAHIAEENLLGEVKHLQKQLTQYRAKWLSAQDEVEELQVKLLQCKKELQSRSTQNGINNNNNNPNPHPSGAENAILVPYLRELESQKEEIHRLERRLERQADSASYREEQLRQEQMDTQRHHRTAIHQLQDQLQAAQRETTRAEEERQRAVKQLRDYVEDGKLKEVLQQQKETLQQRVTELTHEMAELRGNEKELKLSVQREMAEKVQLCHEKAELEAVLKQKERQERLLNEEIQVLTRKAGESEGRAFAVQERLQLLLQHIQEHESSKQKGGDEEGGHSIATAAAALTAAATQLVHQSPCHSHHPEAMASELKGYAALMNLNSQQQQRLSELESKLLTTTNELFLLQQKHQAELQKENMRWREVQMEQFIAGGSGQVGSVGHVAGADAQPDPSSPRLQQLRGSLLAEIAQLRDELERNRHRQNVLLSQWESLHQEHREVKADNLLLASGTEKLMRKLSKLREKNNRLLKQEELRKEGFKGKRAELGISLDRSHGEPAATQLEVKRSSDGFSASDNIIDIALTCPAHCEEGGTATRHCRSCGGSHVSITRQRLEHARTHAHTQSSTDAEAGRPAAREEEGSIPHSHKSPTPLSRSQQHLYAPPLVGSASVDSITPAPGAHVPPPNSAVASAPPTMFSASVPTVTTTTRSPTVHVGSRSLDSSLGVVCRTHSGKHKPTLETNPSPRKVKVRFSAGGVHINKERTEQQQRPSQHPDHHQVTQLEKSLRQAKREIGEYEQLLSLLDATGKLDTLLQEALEHKSKSK